MNRLIAFLAGLLPTTVLAATATVSWSPPTTYTDGTTIPASGPGSIESARVEWGSCSGSNVFGVKAGEVTVPAPATNTTIPNLAAATTYCFRVFARTTYGTESGASNVASKTTPTPVPDPPVLSATITVAYEAVQQGRTLVLGRVVGTVVLGAPCIDNLIQTKQGAFYEIARSEVALTRTPKGVLVTQCAWG